MRIRSIRPEFWSSEDIAAMDWHTRLVYIGLWSYVDDNGVGRDIERLIVADLFPLDEDLPEASRRVTGALRHLSDHGHITRYVVDGKRYLHIVKWTKHQRIEKASKGRYPQPDAEDATIPEPSPTTPGTLPDMSPLGEGEKRRRGEEEKGLTTSSPGSAVGPATPDTFPDFWAIYPRREAKRKAETAYRSAVRRADVGTIHAGAARYRDDPNRDDAFTKIPTTWLNGDCWDDPPLPSRHGSHPPRDRQAEILRAEMAWAQDADAAEQQPLQLTRGA